MTNWCCNISRSLDFKIFNSIGNAEKTLERRAIPIFGFHRNSGPRSHRDTILLRQIHVSHHRPGYICSQHTAIVLDCLFIQLSTIYSQQTQKSFIETLFIMYEIENKSVQNIASVASIIKFFFNI